MRLAKLLQKPVLPALLALSFFMTVPSYGAFLVTGDKNRHSDFAGYAEKLTDAAKENGIEEKSYTVFLNQLFDQIPSLEQISQKTLQELFQIQVPFENGHSEYQEQGFAKGHSSGKYFVGIYLLVSGKPKQVFKGETANHQMLELFPAGLQNKVNKERLDTFINDVVLNGIGGGSFTLGVSQLRALLSIASPEVDKILRKDRKSPITRMLLDSPDSSDGLKSELMAMQVQTMALEAQSNAAEARKAELSQDIALLESRRAALLATVNELEKSIQVKISDADTAVKESRALAQQIIDSAHKKISEDQKTFAEEVAEIRRKIDEERTLLRQEQANLPELRENTLRAAAIDIDGYRRDHEKVLRTLVAELELKRRVLEQQIELGMQHLALSAEQKAAELVKIRENVLHALGVYHDAILAHRIEYDQFRRSGFHEALIQKKADAANFPDLEAKLKENFAFIYRALRQFYLAHPSKDKFGIRVKLKLLHQRHGEEEKKTGFFSRKTELVGVTKYKVKITTQIATLSHEQTKSTVLNALEKEGEFTVLETLDSFEWLNYAEEIESTVNHLLLEEEQFPLVAQVAEQHRAVNVVGYIQAEIAALEVENGLSDDAKELGCRLALVRGNSNGNGQR